MRKKAGSGRAERIGNMQALSPALSVVARSPQRIHVKEIKASEGCREPAIPADRDPVHTSPITQLVLLIDQRFPG
jgi:hypothetical protein